MARTAILAIKILSDTSSASKGMDQAQGRVAKLERGVSKLTGPALAVGGALIAMGVKSFKAASQLQQSTGAVEAVFGRQTKAVNEYARTAADRMGLSTSAYQNFAALTGTALQNAGFTVRQSVGETDKLLQRAADLSALYGGTTADAMDAINAAVSRAEFDPLEKYGVSLNMTAVNAELAKRGQQNLTGAQLKNAKTAVILEQLYGQSAKAAGQFAKESDTAAGQQARASAAIENSAASIGQILLPVVAAASGALASMAGWAGDNATTVQVLAGVLGGLAAAVLLTNGALKVYRAYVVVATAVSSLWNNSILILRARLIAMAVAEKVVAVATKVWSIAMRLLNAAFVSSPIGWIVLAIGLLVGAIVLIATKTNFFQRLWAVTWGAIKKTFSVVWNFIKNNWKLLLAILLGPIAVAAVLIIKYWDKIKAGFKIAVDGIRSGVTAIIGFLMSLPQKAANVIGRLIGAFAGVAKKIWRGAGNIAVAFVNWNKNLPKKAVALVGRLLKVFNNLAPKIWRKAGNIASAFGNWVKNLPGKVKNAVTRILSFYANLGKRVWNKAGSIASAFGTWVSKLPSRAANSVTNILGKFTGLAGKIINKAGNIASQFGTWVSGLPGKAATAITNIIGKFTGLAGKILNAIGSIDLGSLIKMPSKGSGVPFVPGIAAGTDYWRGGLAMVGERGPELAILPRGTRVVPNHELGNTAAAGPVVVELYLDSRLIGRFVESKVDAALGRQVRRVVLQGAP